MSVDVRDAYDSMAERYASLFLGDLDRDAEARHWLAAFAELAAARRGGVADLGCGPGHVTNYLSERGLAVVGYDISEGQVAQARKAFPQRSFRVGDLAALDVADEIIGGIVSRYSIIHLAPSGLGDIFDEWMRVLEAGAPLLLSFFGAVSPQTHGTPFDHEVIRAHALFPATIVALLEDAGFVDVEVGVLPAPEDGRPFDRATVLACKAGPG